MTFQNSINSNSSTPLPSTQGGTGLSNPTAHGVLVGEGSSAVNPIVLSAGQVLIGTTSGDPSAATLTAGTNVTITSASGSITINASGGGSTPNYVFASNSGNQNGVTGTGTAYPVQWTSPTLNGFTFTSPDTFTVPATGIYSVSGTLNITGIASSSNVTQIRINSLNFLSICAYPLYSVFGNVLLNFSTILQLTASETIQLILRVSEESGNVINVIGDGSDYPYLSIVQLG